ncbi:MAG: AP endonuclease [Treponema sp.]|jgi:sugar phosphate isomerase/epimerase|nr:AP endonuclease [Treponema sp.]
MKACANSFILSVPSWVIPGTYAENLRFLETQQEIQGVELLFFIYNDEVKAQLDSEWDEIRNYRERFVFTAHLPELLLAAHSELVARLTPMVRHFIVHPDPKDPVAQVRLLDEWTKDHGAAFLMENTNPGLLEAQLLHMDRGAGLCMDTGHLLLDGKNPVDFFAAYRERIMEIHLHAVDREQAAIDGRLADHRRLRKDEPWLLELLPLLNDYRGVINLEVFSWEEAESGVEILKKLIHK